ncbi:MAG: hypothetical protein AYK18_05615 [Theionarchaea archaeon DG-70]|nr:MAG: hypothetical protein AYK18_05615 [Theionarchaea archaeon DG-70]
MMTPQRLSLMIFMMNLYSIIYLTFINSPLLLRYLVYIVSMSTLQFISSATISQKMVQIHIFVSESIKN